MVMDQLEVPDHAPCLMHKSPSYLTMLRNENFGPITVKKLSPGSR